MVTLKIIIEILSTGRQYLHHFAPIYENIAILYFWITLERCLLYLTNTLQQTVVASFKSKLIYEANIQLLMHTNIQRNINSSFCNYSMTFSIQNAYTVMLKSPPVLVYIGQLDSYPEFIEF